MSAFQPITDEYHDEPRLPLLTLTEARAAVRLLRSRADDSADGREAAQLAYDLASRLPADE
jgi:hypothetical protein